MLRKHQKWIRRVEKTTEDENATTIVLFKAKKLRSRYLKDIRTKLFIQTKERERVRKEVFVFVSSEWIVKEKLCCFYYRASIQTHGISIFIRVRSTQQMGGPKKRPAVAPVKHQVCRLGYQCQWHAYRLFRIQALWCVIILLANPKMRMSWPRNIMFFIKKSQLHFGCVIWIFLNGCWCFWFP